MDISKLDKKNIESSLESLLLNEDLDTVYEPRSEIVVLAVDEPKKIALGWKVKEKIGDLVFTDRSQRGLAREARTKRESKLERL